MRSIRAVFESTWARLTEPERSAFAAMSVFRGGCTQEAALQVTGVGRPVIASLVGKALLWRDAQTGRLSIHELLRQYAEEALESSGQAASVRDAHRIHFAAYTDRWSHALRDDQLNALDHLDHEYDNMVRAFEAAIKIATPEAIRPFTEVWNYFTIRGYLEDGARLLDASIEALGGADSVELARVLTARAEIYGYSYDRTNQAHAALRAIEMFRRLAAEQYAPLALINYLNSALRGDLEAECAVCEEAYELAERAADTWMMTIIANRYSHTLYALGRQDEARSWINRARRLGHPNDLFTLSHTYNHIAHLAQADGDVEVARHWFEMALDASQRIGIRERVIWSEYGLFVLALQTGHIDSAKHYAAEMLRTSRYMGMLPLELTSLAASAMAYTADGDLAKAADYLNLARPFDIDGHIDKHVRLRAGGAFLLRAELPEQAARLLTIVRIEPIFNQLLLVEQRMIDSELDQCRHLLGDARYEEIAEAARRKSLDELEAELHAILDSPSFHPPSTLPD